MRSVRISLSVFSALLLAALAVVRLRTAEKPVFAAGPSDGSLQILQSGKPVGFCPLRHTDVRAGISGFVARVEVTQDFENPSAEKIEAVYTFPLPADAAVDDMTIQIGSRTIRGVIKRREEAAAIYANAVQQGKVAALLDQERPNVFSQSVGNIPPGEAVHVTIRYVVRLKYEDGGYEFVFPMVVAPRYIPGTTAVGHQGGGTVPDTDKVPDASKITPPVAPPGTRAGHDISIAVALDAGVPIQDVRSPSHELDIDHTGASSAIVRLRNAGEIPNKDFILRYNVAGAAIVEGLLTHTAPPGPSSAAMGAPAIAPATEGYFSLIVQPPDRFPESDVTPKEIVFVLDSSGSMDGFPEEKSKRLIDYAIDNLYAGDTFNVIKFSGDTDILFKEPVYPSAENVRRAKQFVANDWGHGGTEMMKAIRAALEPSDSQDHMRIVIFMTDGEVGNDMEIVGEIQKHPNARVFAYGIGASVNRFLLDKMAQAGRGQVEYVSFKRDDKEAEEVAHRLYQHLRSPLLTDVSLDFGSLPVTDVYPQRIDDLFSDKPIVITGRYTGPAQGTVRLLAKRAGDAYTREIPVTLPAQQEGNPVIAGLWAREKIDALMAQDWSGLQRGTMREELRKQITELGLEHHLMTQFTSLVAVEERVVTEGGEPRRIQVPVELPEGMQYEPQWSGERQTFTTANGAPSGSNYSYYSANMLTTLSPGVVATKKPSARAVLRAPSKVATGAGGGGGIGAGGGAGSVGGPVTVPSPTVALPVVTVQDRLGTENAPQSAKSERVIDSKLHPQLVADYDCWQAQADKSKVPAACKLASDTITVRVIASGDAQAALEQLKANGFQAQPASTRKGQFVCHVTIAKLAALAELSFVQFVAPETGSGESMQK
jgi:Ca-activated chloride channel family protein